MNTIFIIKSGIPLFLFSLTVTFSQKYNPCSKFINNTAVWNTKYDSGNYYLIRGNRIDSIKNSYEKIILAWNKNYTVKVKFIRTKNNVIHVNIPDATYLTQSMGTTGASLILASLVYTLTENENYTFVYIDFIEGDHASPGKYSRKDFERKFIVCKEPSKKNVDLTMFQLDCLVKGRINEYGNRIKLLMTSLNGKRNTSYEQDEESEDKFTRKGRLRQCSTTQERENYENI